MSIFGRSENEIINKHRQVISQNNKEVNLRKRIDVFNGASSINYKQFKILKGQPYRAFSTGHIMGKFEFLIFHIKSTFLFLIKPIKAYIVRYKAIKIIRSQG